MRNFERQDEHPGGHGRCGLLGDNGPATAAQLNYPAGLAVDSAGAIYVADSGNNRIRKIVSNGSASVITTVLGASATGGTSLVTPTAVAVNSSGAVFVVDFYPVVHCLTLGGAWIDYAGSSVAGFSGDGGPASAARLSSPHDVAAGGGTVYLADGTRVRFVDVSGAIHTLAGDGYLHAIGDGGLATAAALSLPNAVALDSSGSLFIADTGAERVRQVSAAGIIETLAGTGVAGYGMEPGPATTAPLNIPSGVAMDPAGGVIIADSSNNRIREVGLDGLIRTVVGDGFWGLAPDNTPPLQAPLGAPRGVCVDPAGVIYIVDTSNHRVWRAVPGADLTDAAGNGTPGDAGDGGPARLAQLNSPSACAIDSAGNLYIADTDSHRIRKARPDGIIVTIAGIGQAGFSGDGALATAAALNSPRGVAADSDGNVFIADTGNNRIRQITPDGIMETIAGQDGPAFSGDGGPAVSARLNAPAGLVLDGSGDLYLADSGNNRVRRLVPDGTIAPAVTTQPVAAMVVNAASMAAGPVAPGEIVSIFGTGFGPAVGVSGAFGGERASVHCPGRRGSALRRSPRAAVLRPGRPDQRPGSLRNSGPRRARRDVLSGPTSGCSRCAGGRRGPRHIPGDRQSGWLDQLRKRPRRERRYRGLLCHRRRPHEHRQRHRPARRRAVPATHAAGPRDGGGH